MSMADDSNDDTIGDAEFSDHEFNDIESVTSDTDTSEAVNKRRGEKRNRVRSRVGESSRIFEILDGICDVILNRRRDLPGCSALEVIRTVRGLPGIVAGDELFMKAVDILTKKENREMFVAIEDPEIQVAWLKQKNV